MDALTAIVTLLKPQAINTKVVHGNGRWGVRYPAFEQPSFALILKGSCWLAVDGIPEMILETGDFVLFPSMSGFTVATDPDVRPKAMDLAPCGPLENEVFHGDTSADPSVSMLGGYFAFDQVNSSILLEILPKVLRIHANEVAIDSVATIIELVRRETNEKRTGRELVLTRLIEVLLVEALRSVRPDMHATGLLAGLQDPQLAAALRCIHTETAHPWTLATLAREAAMSRSSFAQRFARLTGVTPMNYLLQWRLAIAKNMLAHERMSVAETALAVGYDSASGFSTAFSRETGQSPKEFIDLHRGSK